MMTTRRISARLLAATIATIVLASPTYARADDDEQPDARTAGYKSEVTMAGSSAGSFAILALLAAIGIGVMFKNPNRSHLD